MKNSLILIVAAAALMLAPAAQAQAPTYSCETCPANWGNLEPDNSCGDGAAQSPIAINKALAVTMPLPMLDFYYGITPLQVNRTDTNLESAGEGVVLIGGVEYDFSQFHFHTLSEHFVDGEQFAMELHLVNKTAKGETTVLGRFIKPGENLDELDDLIEVFEELVEAGDESADGGLFDLRALVPESEESLRYEGSTTTPGCAEGTSWILFLEELELSEEQIEDIRASILTINDGFDNFRPIQSVNGRKVYTDEGLDSDDESDDDESDDDESDDDESDDGWRRW